MQPDSWPGRVPSPLHLLHAVHAPDYATFFVRLCRAGFLNSLSSQQGEAHKPVQVHDFMMGLAEMASAEGDGRILFVIAALIAVVGIAISFHDATSPRRPR
jgi:hypothetical protein